MQILKLALHYVVGMTTLRQPYSHAYETRVLCAGTTFFYKGSVIRRVRQFAEFWLEEYKTRIITIQAE